MKIKTFNLSIGIPVFCLFIAIMLISAPCHSQGVSINETNTPPDPSAMLEVQSNEKGVLVPRMTQVQRNAIANPAAGLLIYQTNQTPGFYFNAGTPALPNWQPVGYNTIWRELGNDIYRFDGNVGFGTATPNHRVHVNNGNIYATTSSFAIRGVKTGPGTFPGVWGETESASNNATGVRGYVISTTPGTGSSGVHGRNFGTGSAGNGVRGTHDGAGFGVFGETVLGTGVYGVATDNNDGDTYGVRGLVYSNNGVAVYGKNEGSGNYGMLGAFQAAVWGFHPSGNNTRIATSFDGLVASSTISTNGYSIFAIQGSALRAAQIQGNMTVTGTLAKGGGSFEIDHPLDPSNKILRHSFVESPDMMNVYNGNVTTDDQGTAIIVLPHYFEVLNRDFRYQLTVMGQFAQAIVSREIEKNSFEISTDKPNVKVSWQVTGIRQDHWAEANRIVIEEDKSDMERGFYIHPEVFGLPENRQMEWGRRGEYMQLLHDDNKRMMELSKKDANKR